VTGRARLLDVALLALCGCTQVSVHVAVLRPIQGSSPHPVELHDVGYAPARPYDEVAELQAVGPRGIDGRGGVTHAVAARAADIGCDAVVDMQIDEGRSRVHAFGRCVRWLR
jgi:hypothetical protein